MAQSGTRKRQNTQIPPSPRTSAHLFSAAVVLFFLLFDWPLRWLLSGAPLLSYALLLGDANGYRVLPFASSWTLISTLNLSYAICATSWLLYWVFAAGCYPLLFLTCLFQFNFVARPIRRTLRSFLKQLDFVNDNVAYFELPALEIDTEVQGLFVIRGLTISFSSLTIVAHGVEIGIKLSDDMELALQVEETTVSLFRKIEVGDVYGNLKGGQFEMTFGQLAKDTRGADGEPMMETDTPLLKAAASWKIGTNPIETMKERMTGGRSTRSSSLGSALAAMTQLSPDDEAASKRYERALKEIDTTSPIRQSSDIFQMLCYSKDHATPTAKDWEDEKAVRAAICSQLHDQPSVPHPPKRSIKVTTLQNLSSLQTRRFLHRLPMLLRLLLNPLSYFHPVTIASITVSGSGSWIQHMLRTTVFKAYSDDNKSLRDLEKRIMAWLGDANFVAQLVSIHGFAAVPFLTNYDITALLKLDDLIVHRTLPAQIQLAQVVRLGGADASISLPIFLLPHHEHLFPPRPTARDKDRRVEAVQNADGMPKTVQAAHQLKTALHDQAEMTVVAHARLPAVFDQQVLDFVAALVKATKVIELEKEPGAMEAEIHGVKEWGKAVRAGVRDGIKKATVDGIVNDRWIAKLVGKVTRKLEVAQGDVGYSGKVPIQMEWYRENAETASKILK